MEITVSIQYFVKWVIPPLLDIWAFSLCQQSTMILVASSIMESCEKISINMCKFHYYFVYQAEKGNNTTLPTLFGPAVKLLSSSKVSTSKWKRHLWCEILNMQVQIKSKYLYDPTPCWLIHVNSKTISADMTPSLLRPSTPWVKKNPFSEKKKLEGEPQMKDPLSLGWTDV